MMIVSSHKEVREGLGKVLGLAGGIEVAGAIAIPATAIENISLASPDVALVDLDMPDFDGYEMIRQLRRRCPATRPIALTAHDYPAARERALEAGACSVMVKGMDVPAMVSAIQSATGTNRN